MADPIPVTNSNSSPNLGAYEAGRAIGSQCKPEGRACKRTEQCKESYDEQAKLITAEANKKLDEICGSDESCRSFFIQGFENGYNQCIASLQSDDSSWPGFFRHLTWTLRTGVLVYFTQKGGIPATTLGTNIGGNIPLDLYFLEIALTLQGDFPLNYEPLPNGGSPNPDGKRETAAGQAGLAANLLLPDILLDRTAIVGAGGGVGIYEEGPYWGAVQVGIGLDKGKIPAFLLALTARYTRPAKVLGLEFSVNLPHIDDKN